MSCACDCSYLCTGNDLHKILCYPTCQFARSFISDYTEIPICAAAMRLGRRAILPLVRTTSTTTKTSPTSLPPAVLSVGHALRERRRFTEADVAAYAAVSGDRNPVHLDDAAAQELGGFHRGRVVHGMLVASLFPSIIAACFVRALLPPFLLGISSNST